MDTRPPNIWFLAAWTLLVVVVAFGFFLQARTISRLEEDEQAINAAIVRNREMMCDLFLIVTDAASEDRHAVTEVFERAGVECPALP